MQYEIRVVESENELRLLSFKSFIRILKTAKVWVDALWGTVSLSGTRWF